MKMRHTYEERVCVFSRADVDDEEGKGGGKVEVTVNIYMS
jgi:hypothetical protein